MIKNAIKAAFDSWWTPERVQPGRNFCLHRNSVCSFLAFCNRNSCRACWFHDACVTLKSAIHSQGNYSSFFNSYFQFFYGWPYPQLLSERKGVTIAMSMEMCICQPSVCASNFRFLFLNSGHPHWFLKTPIYGFYLSHVDC